jgi:hypothetical protein
MTEKQLLQKGNLINLLATLVTRYKTGDKVP